MKTSFIARTSVLILSSLSILMVPVVLSDAFAQEPSLTMSIESATLNSDATVTVAYTVSCSEAGIVSYTAIEVSQEPRTVHPEKGLGDDSWEGRRYGVELDDTTQYQCEPGDEIEITQTTQCFKPQPHSSNENDVEGCLPRQANIRVTALYFTPETCCSFETALAMGEESETLRL
jgi:hypothetical protein